MPEVDRYIEVTREALGPEERPQPREPEERPPQKQYPKTSVEDLAEVWPTDANACLTHFSVVGAIVYPQLDVCLQRRGSEASVHALWCGKCSFVHVCNDTRPIGRG